MDRWTGSRPVDFTHTLAVSVWVGAAVQVKPCGSRKLADAGVSRQTEEGHLAIPAGILWVVPSRRHGSMPAISC